MKPKHYWFYDELLLFNFRLVWPVTTETLVKYIKDEFDEIYEGGPVTGGKALTITNENGQQTFVVALPEWKGNANCHSVLVHECNHIALMILENRHVEVTIANDECFCYLTAYLVRQCLNVLLPKRLRVEVDPKVKPKRALKTCS